MSVDDMQQFLAARFPQVNQQGEGALIVEEVGLMSCRMRLIVGDRHLRPGGTVSGPTMFTLADVALYVAILGQIGPVELAVTTSFTINFLRRPAQRDMIAQCRLLKLGRNLAVGEVALFSEGGGEPVAHATGTYAIPR
ncbi:MAG: PaaI family thioesterase [Hyphomicrobiales bacterium]|nr:PaaI family thioesterase [Hyphomicrobiales bacterium]